MIGTGRFERAALLGVLCIAAACSSDKRQARTATDEEGEYQPIASEETGMSPAARRMTEEERRRQMESESAAGQQGEQGMQQGATATLDCPVDVADTNVAVVSEATGISMVFKVADPSDTAALDALRLRVRGLAERYRSERMATGGTTSPSMTPGGSQEQSASTERMGGSRSAESDTSSSEETGEMGSESASSPPMGEIAITVQDTEDGAKILIASEDVATLDVLRARLAQDAQIMTQTGSCPW